jgi:hypothetical protein
MKIDDETAPQMEVQQKRGAGKLKNLLNIKKRSVSPGKKSS